MTSTITLNQVNLPAVAGLVAAIQATPAKAQTKWSSEVRWTGAFQTEASVRNFDAIRSDEPATLGGSDTAPNPVEQLLSALGNCLAVGYAANATIAGIAIDQLSISLEGDLDLHVFLGLAEGHAGFSAIRAVVDLQADASDEAIADLHAKVAATSPVGHTVNSAVPLTISPR
ncbi:MAG: OsmC family protein [Nocardiaceae bacterium]|nr:OsmC family protein [Nocardiaceae bacterium]